MSEYTICEYDLKNSKWGTPKGYTADEIRAGKIKPYGDAKHVQVAEPAKYETTNFSHHVRRVIKTHPIGHELPEGKITRKRVVLQPDGKEVVRYECAIRSEADQRRFTAQGRAAEIQTLLRCDADHLRADRAALESELAALA